MNSNFNKKKKRMAEIRCVFVKLVLFNNNIVIRYINEEMMNSCEYACIDLLKKINEASIRSSNIKHAKNIFLCLLFISKIV